MDSVVIRFPDGMREFRCSGRALVTGVTVWHDGEHYRVISLSDDQGRVVALVEPDSGIGDLPRSEEGAIRLEPVVPA